MNITLGIIIITGLVSYMAFSRYDLFDKLKFSPPRVLKERQYYRLFTYALLHGGWGHLLVNMLVFYSFGSAVEKYFYLIFGSSYALSFLLLYLGAIVFSNALALRKHKDNYLYSAVGASGGVAAVLFASILFNPWGKIYFFGVLPIPGVAFGVIYLYYCYRMNKKGADNIAHDAHFLGAIFGFVFPILMKPYLLERFFNALLRF
ncbi:MAG: rhomboid family intramembrane serine protease [Mangrovibacterium sp.]